MINPLRNMKAMWQNEGPFIVTLSGSNSWRDLQQANPGIGLTRSPRHKCHGMNDGQQSLGRRLLSTSQFPSRSKRVVCLSTVPVNNPRRAALFGHLFHGMRKSGNTSKTSSATLETLSGTTLLYQGSNTQPLPFKVLWDFLGNG
jgi:hypothetical protein